jgi:hypothetical protein
MKWVRRVILFFYKKSYLFASLKFEGNIWLPKTNFLSKMNGQLAYSLCLAPFSNPFLCHGKTNSNLLLWRQKSHSKGAVSFQASSMGVAKLFNTHVSLQIVSKPIHIEWGSGFRAGNSKKSQSIHLKHQTPINTFKSHSSMATNHHYAGAAWNTWTWH